ncbi:MAG: tRNA pseudouridine(38-40) synthase TruA [Spirochaetia bacterium]|nr:tRNA pseudouridine(38-40) synthase TruA [Spirochaetia bacterium]
MKIALTIQYNGLHFHGFQRQTGERSVQEEIENILKIYFRSNVRIHCAGRTDSGVHSAGQVIHFEINESDLLFRTKDVSSQSNINLSLPHKSSNPHIHKFEMHIDRMIYNLNCILPKDISIIYGNIVPDDFHARFSCQSREYIYGIITSKYRMAMYQNNHLWIRYPVDLDSMRQAAEYLIGEHDFASFTKNIYKVTNEITIRRVDKIYIIPKDSFLYFYFHGSGFLHNMIRIITGTLLLVGRGDITPFEVQNILKSQNRVNAGNTLPAFPLVFLNARYRDYQTPHELIPYYEMLGL